MNIETIAQFKPKNDANFPIVDTLDIKGGYLPFQTLDERNNWTTQYTSRLTIGLLCHVTATGYYYSWDGTSWEEAQMGSGGSGGNVIIQDTAPLNSEGLQRTGAVWIDTSEKGLNLSSTTVQSLIKMINVLGQRVSLLEYMNQLICSGEFSNNMYDVYGSIVGIDPESYILDEIDESENDGTTENEDDWTEALLNDTLLTDSEEPTQYKDILPNVKHIQVKWGKYNDMQTYKDSFMPAELLWCYDKKQLWIKDPKTYKLIQIGTASTSGGTTDETEDIMNGIIQSGDYIGSISFVDMVDSTKHYTFGVKNGELDLYDDSLDVLPNSLKSTNLSSTDTTTGVLYYKNEPYIPTTKSYYVAGDDPTYCSMLGINAVYGASYDDYNYCDYNFIELANLTPEDVNLNGMYLHITEDNENWISLPLKGVIKAYKSFLVRGAKAADSKFAAVHIKSGDYIWSKGESYNTSKANSTLFDSDGLIVIPNNCSILFTGPLTDLSSTGTDFITATKTILTTGLSLTNPWSTTNLVGGFMDLVGFGTKGGSTTSMLSIKAACSALAPNKLYCKYYNLDPVSQAYKSVFKAAAANNVLWTYIQLDDTDLDIDLAKWTLEKGGHDIFFDKHLLESGKPNIITCSFGYNANTTRCFNWVSKGYRNEYLRYRKQGETNWNIVESFKKDDKRSSKNNRDDEIYNRIRAVSADGTYFTVHKLILDFDEPTSDNVLTYEYQAGYDLNWTDIKTFTLRNNTDVINSGFSFVQVTDQQGFNAEEYNTWRLAAEYINLQKEKENTEESKIHFVINTGDATQNGNRMNEWIDYFNSGDSLFNNMEQMYTVGNNDLCALVPQAFGDGLDVTKCNPVNVEYFFTFEHPYGIPKSSNGKYIPCVYSFIYGNTYFLCINSEITDSDNSAALTIWGQNTNTLYNQVIKPWCEEDLTYLPDTIKWKIDYCHENPFTIIIKDVISGYGSDGNNWRGKVTSHCNNPGGYWHSKFLEDNGFNLSICGHKHTFSTSYYLRDNEEDRMSPYIWNEGLTLVASAGKYLGTLEEDESKNYVKYTMCLATGYKLISNKELPADNITFLESYFPSNSNKSDSRVGQQQYPMYIVWNIGTGTEVNDPAQSTTSRDRILGKVKMLTYTSNGNTTSAVYKYNGSRIQLNAVSEKGGNGNVNSNNNIIVEKLKIPSVSGITINNLSEITTNQYNVTAKVLPLNVLDKTYTLTMEDNDNATFENGVLTVTGDTSVTFTAVANEDNTISTTRTFDILYIIPLVSLDLSISNNELSVTYNPTNTTQTGVTYTMEDNDNATLNGNKITITDDTTVKVTATSIVNSNISVTKEFELTLLQETDATYITDSDLEETTLLTENN